MFLEVRKAGKSKKFYAVYSLREGGKVVKLRRYLGKDLSATELAKRKKQAASFMKEQVKNYKEIRDPLTTQLSGTEIKQLLDIEARADVRIIHLDERQWFRFSQVFSYNTNAIEGSTLTLRDVRNIIERHKMPDKSEADIEEAKGVVEAIEYIRRAKNHVSVALIKGVHRIVFKKTKPFAGQFRSKGIEVAIKDKEGNIVHLGAPSAKIRTLLTELTRWYNEHKHKYPPILLAAVVHNQFENIHPFQDGNGRVGRLLLNNILLRHRLPPVNISFSKRQAYYESLRAYQNTGNIRPTVELIVNEYRRYARQAGDHKKRGRGHPMRIGGK
ncbi:Fic family protein [Candidatus Woesearchaeota archaeon]|nr:Fic family protein [Candidatus Woesearchaeota archaeon]